MPFHSGRVSYSIYRVVGDGPTSFDDTTLSLLREFAFRETEIGEPEEVEVGFGTGEHLFDTQFTYEKNAFGSPGDESLLLAMRMDTHKVPADVKQAYRRMHEQAAAEASQTGFASKAEKRTAAEEAARALRDDLATGKYRRSKQVPLLWHLRKGVLLSGASGNAVHDALVGLFKQAFALQLDQLSAGGAARELLSGKGLTRDFEDLRPSAFTDPPADFLPGGDDAGAADAVSSSGRGGFDAKAPLVPWVVKAVDYKDFLGNEFLMWLWWLSETAEGEASIAGEKHPAYLSLVQSLEMECAWDVRGKQTLRDDGPTRLPEAGEALFHGKWPRKAGLIVSDGEYQWQLGLQGDKLTISSASLPEVEDVQSPRELIEGRLERTWRLHGVVMGMYASFVERRCSGKWDSTRQDIRKWITKRVKR